MTTGVLMPAVTDHCRERWRQRFGGADMAAAFARSVPVRLSKLRAEAKAAGVLCHLSPGGELRRDGVTLAVFVIVCQPDGRAAITTVIRWKYGTEPEPDDRHPATLTTKRKRKAAAE